MRRGATPQGAANYDHFTRAETFEILVSLCRSGVLRSPKRPIRYTAGDGGALIWPQLIGYARAREYLLTGDPLIAKDAAEIGLITRAVAADKLDETVYGMAERLAKGATFAINTTKQAINMVLRRQFESIVEAHSGLELMSHFTADHAEAAHAFLEKRKPNFMGRTCARDRNPR